MMSNHQSYLRILCIIGNISISYATMIVKESSDHTILTESMGVYTSLGYAEPMDRHVAMVSIQQRNLDVIESLLYEVSDKKSPKYGKFLSHDEIGKFHSVHGLSIDF